MQFPPDPLSDGDQCALDIPLMKSMGFNTINVLQTDPSLNHDRCMQVLADNGMYLFLDLTDVNNDPVCVS